MPTLKTAEDIRQCVSQTVERTPVIDIHTHLYPPWFGRLLLWGIDDLLTYHYLVAEVLRRTPMDCEHFWKLTKTEQANLVWRKLFIENSPVSEACRGPLSVLKILGIDLRSRKLDAARDYFNHVTTREYVDIVFQKARVKKVVMTNDPFDPAERAVWMKKPERDRRFAAALRIDGLLTNWTQTAPQLRTWSYKVRSKIDGETVTEVRRFLLDWIKRIRPLYLAASLPPDFTYPDKSARSTLIRHCVLPTARRAGLPFALMIGARRLVNPGLRLAGDSVGVADGSVVETLCRESPENRFLVTMLSRENQHQLCVSARKFRNLMPFGCWWFLNNPGLVEETTRMRTELLGLSYVPQHSDARILDQLLYKWAHSRGVIAEVLSEKYQDLAATGWQVKSEDVTRDVENLFGGNFEQFLAETPRGK
jgi:hypothetical protein